MGLNGFVWLLLTLIWGSTWLGIKFALMDLPPFTCAVWRFILAVIPVMLYMKSRGQSFPKGWRDLGLIAITGQLTFSINYGLVFWSETLISSGLAAVLYALFPLFGMMQSVFFLKSEPITRKRFFGTLLGIAGIVVIFQEHLALNNIQALMGSSAILIAAFGTAFSGILIKKHLLHIPSASLTATQMLMGIPTLLLLALREPFSLPSDWTGRAWLSLLYLAVLGSALTFSLYNWLITRIELSICNLIPLGSTLMAVWLGWLVLHEPISSNMLTGTLLIMAGLGAAIIRRK